MESLSDKKHEYTQCEGAYEELLAKFKEKRITTVAVVSIPLDGRWMEENIKTPGMKKIRTVYNRAWHMLETPEQACRFAFETNDKVFHGNLLMAMGLQLKNSSFDEVVNDFRDGLTKRGIVNVEEAEYAVPE